MLFGGLSSISLEGINAPTLLPGGEQQELRLRVGVGDCDLLMTLIRGKCCHGCLKTIVPPGNKFFQRKELMSSLAPPSLPRPPAPSRPSPAQEWIPAILPAWFLAEENIILKFI